MSRSVDPLVVGRVIGDVIDMFAPSVDMAVLYTSRQVLARKSMPYESCRCGELNLIDVCAY